MKNFLWIRTRSRLKIRICGKNIERMVTRLISNGIDLLNMKYPKKDTVEIEIFSSDYEKVEELKTVYEVTIIRSYGILHTKKKILFYKELLLALFVGACFLIVLSNTIFQVKVIHTDSKVRTFLTKELEKYGVREYRFKKSFDRLEEIRKKIMYENKDKVEWLEIETVGTSYIVRVEMRKMEEKESAPGIRNIIAKKDAIITRVIAQKGAILRTKNDYVKKGDVIISGEIFLNEEVKNVTSAKGKVYGEVWYQTKIEYPLNIKEVTYTGRRKEVYGVRFLNHVFEFAWPRFKEKEYQEEKLLFHPILPFGIVKQKQKEVKKVSGIYSEKEAIKKAEQLGRKKMEEKLKNDEYIIRAQKTKVEIKKSKVIVDIFYSVCEDITDYATIEERQENS